MCEKKNREGERKGDELKIETDTEANEHLNEQLDQAWPFRFSLLLLVLSLSLYLQSIQSEILSRLVNYILEIEKQTWKILLYQKKLFVFFNDSSDRYYFLLF